jgi:hypothetical protein
VYARRIQEKTFSFGVSGLLYNSNVLMYDHQTESLWLQVRREAVTGPMTGTRLRVYPSTVTTWAKWLKRFPATTVLTPATGHMRDYSRDPYESYYRSRRGMFSIFKAGPGEEEKELVAGVEWDGAFKAYPVDLLREKGTLDDSVGSTALRLNFDPSTDRLAVRTDDGVEIVPIVTYWFVWKGIHPETERFSGNP